MPPWTGANDRLAEGVFRWENGEAVTFNHWKPGQPNGGINQNCVRWETISIKEGFEDKDCGLIYNVICEKPSELLKRFISYVIVPIKAVFFPTIFSSSYSYCWKKILLIYQVSGLLMN